MNLYDKKAVKILFDTHWTSQGWRSSRSTPPADLAYAIRKGVMLPPQALPHDATLHRLRELCESLRPAQLGDAFLASLASRMLALRSALGSFAVARFLRVHEFEVNPRSGACKHCGLYPEPTETVDLNVLNFERLKWGGVRHRYTEYQVFDLEQFHKLPPFEPTNEDLAIFHRILAVVETLPANATAAHLVNALSGVLASNNNERRSMIEILSLCGILSYPGYHNYFDNTKPPTGRPSRDSDWGVPTMFWRAQDGCNVESLREYFPRYADAMIEDRGQCG